MTKVAIVTGGSRGIGAACCRLLAKKGYAVVVNYAGNRAAAEAVAGEIMEAGGTAVTVQGDVAIEADVLRIFAAADQLGTLGVLVNNAGVVDLPARVDEMSVERLTRMFTINIIGSFVPSRRGHPAHVHQTWWKRRRQSSTCLRQPPPWARPGNMWIMLPRKARLTVSPSAWRGNSLRKAFASMPFGPA